MRLTNPKSLPTCVAIVAILVGLGSTMTAVPSQAQGYSQGFKQAEIGLSLKPMPQASGPQITFGDVFEDAGPLANQAIALAPNSGQTVVFGVGPMQARVRAAGGVWLNKEGVRQIVVQGPEQTSRRATNPASSPSLRQSAPVSDTGVSEPKVLAVLGRAIARGEEIRAEDVVWLDAPKVAPRDALDDPDFLIGKTAKRDLSANVPLRAMDVAAKPAVRRNEPVTLLYEASGMKLSLRGRALADAPIGATIRVINPQSKKILEAVVEGPGMARVMMSQLSAQLVNKNGSK
jgi:flagella basal body P-ring formation protein FlgA